MKLFIKTALTAQTSFLLHFHFAFRNIFNSCKYDMYLRVEWKVTNIINYYGEKILSTREHAVA
jgi:hypothetical protein